jgi:hypothetical protein
VHQIKGCAPNKIHFAGVKVETEQFGKLNLVWVIGVWNLGIVCNLLFDAWNFVCSKTW